ncbi:MAG: hypothetical protein K2O46_07650 [Bacteroidales bacterium]|nr:hypothetical protein [Bacteroidales bacterium]
MVNLGGGVAYRFAKHHQLDLRVNLRVKHTLGADTAPDTPAARTDFTGTLRYAYRF